MPSSPEKLIETAVRSISENAELHLAAMDFLRPLRTGDDKGAATAISRWNAVDAKKRKPVWGIALWAMFALVSLAVGILDCKEIIRYARWGKWASGGLFSMGTPPYSTEAISRGLNDKQKLLLFGDLTKTGISAQKEALWQSDPENPAYFAEYANAYLSEHDNLPPDYLETARRIDPTNAWFTYLAAAHEGDKCVESNPRKGIRVGGKRVYNPRTWKILDADRLDRAITLLSEARGQTKCESYTAEMLRKRIPLLPSRSLIDQLDSMGCLALNHPTTTLKIHQLSKVVAAKAWSLGDAGDVEGFNQLSTDGEAFVQRMTGSEAATLIEGLVNLSDARSLAENFAPAAEKLGLRDDAARWKKIDDRLIERDELKRSRGTVVVCEVAEADKTTGCLLGMSLTVLSKQVENPPPLTDVDLKPGRGLDHDVLSRFSGYAVWILLGLALGLVAAFRFRMAVLVRRLARRMEGLLLPMDWVRIIGAGVVMPFVYVMGINLFTPLGGRNFGMAGTQFLLPSGHFAVLLVLWLVMPIPIICRRLAKRAGVFGFEALPFPADLVVVCAAAAVPVIGCILIVDSTKLFPFSVILLGFPAIWLFVIMLLSLFCGAKQQLHHAAASFVLIKAYAAAMVLIAFSTMAFKASERYWFSQDTMMKLNAKYPGWSPYEYKVSVQLQKELREVLTIGN